MIALRLATNAAVPAAPAAARAVMPTAKAIIPTPAARAPTPIKAMAAPRSNKIGTIGVRTNPATPRTVKTPTNMSSEVPTAARSMAPKAMSTGAIMFSATAIRIIAAAPAAAPVIMFAATPIASTDTASIVSPRVMASHSIAPKANSTGTNTFNAAATISMASAPPMAVVILAMTF